MRSKLSSGSFFRWVFSATLTAPATAAAAVVSSNMFIEKNGRNFCFGQLTIKGWSFVSPSRLIALYQKGHTAAKKCRTWPEKEEEEESVAAPFLKRLTTRSNWDWRGVKQQFTVHYYSTTLVTSSLLGMYLVVYYLATTWALGKLIIQSHPLH